MQTPILDELMRRHSWLPFKIVNPKTCEVMGLKHGSIHLGYYDSKRGRIDLLRGSDFKPYMSLTSDSAIPMNALDPQSFSILTKMYVATMFHECYSHSCKFINNELMTSVAKNVGVSKPTLKNWIKRYEN